MNISRRKFLGSLGAVAATAALGSTKAFGAADKDFKGFPGSFGVLHDTSKCIGCRKCEQACNEVNALPAPDRPFSDLEVLNRKRRTSAGTYTVVNRFDAEENPVFVKKQCNHCLEPACASACFVKALKKDRTGAVVYDESLCVGCRYCMVACPFNIPAFEYNDPVKPAVTKCTMCFTTRIQKGALPACVEECPKEALFFGEREKLLRAAWKTLFDHPDRYVQHVYGEHEMGGTSWMYISHVPFSKIGMREDLGTVSAPEFTAGPLSAVPIVVGLWPVFLTGIYAVSKRKESMAKKEKEEAVRQTKTLLEEDMALKLEKQREKLAREKESAINYEVKKALEEAARKSEEPSNGEKEETEGD